MSDPGKAVFLSYASQDAEAAKRICDALRASGVEVWFDAEGGLEHGDEWDAKIRRQIKECVLFLPIISANTQAREEGYFRIEWELAAQRALGIASGVAFILPIVIDDTREPDALVPDRFRSVQWTRLRGGELTPEVKARFLKLWSHRSGMVKHLSGEPGNREQRSEDRGQGGPAGALANPGWRVYAGLGGAIFALVAVVGWWMLRPPATGATVPANAATPPPAIPAPPPAPVNPAGAETGPRQLVAKAHALFEALDSTRDDYKLAEELIAQAKAAGANDAEAWAADAQLNTRYFIRGWDTSDARREAARVAAQRAQRLDPSSFEARFAQAGLLGYTGREGMEKEKLLRDLRPERPADHRVLRELGSTLERQGRVDEGIAFMDEAAALPGGDPLALYNKSLGYWFAGRTVEAEAAMRAAIAQKPFTGAQLMSVWYAMALHGDLDGARATLDRIAPAELQEDRGCFFAYYLSFLRREPDAAIERLRALPRDWINDNWYRGPKGRLVGNALQLAGRTEAAMAEWRAALKLVDTRLAADPTNWSLQYNRILLLAQLGEKDEAARLFAILAQSNAIDLTGGKAVPPWVTDVYSLLGRKNEAIKQIALGLQQQRRAVSYTAALLRLDPTFDPVRSEADFAQVIAQAGQIEQAAAIAATPPRDWPKDLELKRAMSLLGRLDMIPEDIRLAEEITQHALDKASTDPEVVTMAAMAQSLWLLRGWDRSNDRYLKAQRLAERALQLAPDEPEAMLAMATYLYQRGTGLERAHQLMARAIALNPNEPRYYRLRDNVLFVDAAVSPAKAFASAEQTIARFPRDALVHYELARHYRNASRWADFERENNAALALAPVANALVWKARGQAWLHNDLVGMKASLDQVPDRMRTIERTVYAYFIYSVMSGSVTEGIAALNGMAEPWMIDFDYRGPKALPLGALLELQGKPSLARLQYESALQELKRHRAETPDDPFLWLNEAFVLHGLGREEEARAAIKISNEAIERPYQISAMNSWWFHPLAGNLLLGERAAALALLREAASVPDGRATIRSRMAADPRMAPFRDDPEIKALLAEPEGAKP